MKPISQTKAALLAIALCWGVVADAEVAVPQLKGHITDQTGTLSTEQQAALERSLQALEAKKGSQLAVLIVATTEPETIEQYSLRVAEQWKLGRKKVDDGAILVVAKNDRAVRIEVGYGLEGALNDATSKRIISETITPRLKEGDYHGGIAAGVDQITKVIEGEPLPEPASPAGMRSDVSRYIPILFLLAIVVGGLLRSVLGRLPGSLVTGGIVAVIAWFFAGTVVTAVLAGAIALFFTLVGGSMMGPAVGGMLGGLGGGGMRGGGFGGGGGGFGGGGASGRF